MLKKGYMKKCEGSGGALNLFCEQLDVNDRFSTVRACTGVIELRCYTSFFINVASQVQAEFVFFPAPPAENTFSLQWLDQML